MSSFEQLKQTFFDECGDLLQQIENGLTEIREGTQSEDTINAVFRAVHSVKGGAGIFGFETLVGFAHVFETVLDAMRSDKLAVTPDNVDLMLASSDVLTDLVNMSRAGETPPANHGSECRTGLQALMGGSDDEVVAGDGHAAADFDIAFTPVQIDLDEGIGDPVVYEITFKPGPEMLKKGSDPLNIIRELRQLGELELTADVGALPDMSAIAVDKPCVSWTGKLKTTRPQAEIEGVFDFVADDCEFSIVNTAPPPPPLVIEAAPLPVVDNAPSLAPAGDKPKAAGKADAPASEGKPQKAAATTTRVELEKIDRVVNMVGELVIAQAMLGQIVHELPEHVSARLQQTLDEVVHHTRELKDGVMSMRAQPVGAVFQRMPRLVRELSVKTAKKVRLEMAGENTEVDRSIVEQLSDPLTHIIRNSMDHGIESPADRISAGKNEEGTIRLSASHRGGRIVIEISDDGAGINSDRVLRKAREKGLVAADATLTEDEINNLVFMPGFSTAETVSDISGRGVGMDVVRRNIQDIGGRISLKSERGRGMTIQLALPLTLAVMDGMVIRVGRETYVVPMSAMVECLRPPRSDIHDLVGTRGMLKLRGELLPIVDLGDLLDVKASDSEGGVVIITEAGEDIRFGLRVDELCGHQQVVIKSIEESYGSIPGISAATILGNGRVAFILDTEKLYEMAGVPPAVMAAAKLEASTVRH